MTRQIFETSVETQLAPTLSPGELQRLRLATQVRSNLFGVVYVLDEPSAGLHPADAEPLLDVLDRLKASGNSLFVVEHDLDDAQVALDRSDQVLWRRRGVPMSRRWRRHPTTPGNRPTPSWSTASSSTTARKR